MPVDHQRIAEAHLAVGEPLQWDVHDAQGHLLLRKGYVLENETQIERLVDSGLYVKRDELAATEKAASEGDATSAVIPLLEAREIEDQAAAALKNGDIDVAATVTSIITRLRKACEINADIALAFIQLRQRGAYATRHQVDTALLCCLVGASMKLAEHDLDALLSAALTMNLGMLEVQDKLNTITGELAPAVKQAIRAHPQKSVDKLRQLGISDSDWLDLVLQHHESEDGSGYPAGLTGEYISLGAKILNVADRYCARITPRGDRPLALPSVALRDLLLERGRIVSPEVAAHFIKVLGVYPPGTMVRLMNGEIGVVTKRAQQGATPWVHAVIGPFGADLEFPIRRKTSDELHAIKEGVDPRKHRMPFRMYPIWGKEAAGG